MVRTRKTSVNSKRENNIVDSAVKEGISAIMKHHPRFRKYEEYILNHINTKKLNQKIKKIYERIKNKKDWDEEKQTEYLYEELSDYVATGAAFDEEGKEIILKSSLEEKAKSGFLKRSRARKTLEGEEYLDGTLNAFQDLYSLFKTGGYEERMPELAEAVTTVNDMGFLDPAVDILKYHGLIDARKYNILKKNVRKRTEEGVEKTLMGIERYVMPQKIAVAVLGIFGLSLLFVFGRRITGGIIGSSFNGTTIGFFGGILLLIASLILFLKIPKNKLK